MEKRELILADKSRQKINCTLWGVDAVNFSASGTPIILIRSARVSFFQFGLLILYISQWVLNKSEFFVLSLTGECI